MIEMKTLSLILQGFPRRAECIKYNYLVYADDYRLHALVLFFVECMVASRMVIFSNDNRNFGALLQEGRTRTKLCPPHSGQD